MRGGCARRIVPPLLVPRDLSWESPRATACRLGHRPFGGAPGYSGQCVGRSQVASRWVPSPTCLRPSDFSAATFQPFRSGVFRAAGPEVNGLKRSTWPEATWRSGD